MTQTTSITTRLNNNGSWYISYYCENGRLRYPCGVKAKRSLTAAEQKKIEAIDKTIKKYVDLYALHEKKVIKAELEEYLDKKFRPEKIEKKEADAIVKETNTVPLIVRDFVEDHKQMIMDMCIGKVLKKDGGVYSDESIAQYERIREKWEKCARETESDAEIRFRLSYQMGIEDCKNLLNWATKTGYSRNHIYDITNLLKIYLKWSHKKGYHTNPLHTIISDHIQIQREETEAIAPTYDEILKLYQHKFDNPNYERARDFFVLGCFLALRVSDLRRINEYDITTTERGDEFQILTKKGQKKVTIPCHWIAKEIWNKYKVDLRPWHQRIKVPKQFAKHYKTGELPVFPRSNLAYYLPKICKGFINGRKLTTLTLFGVKTETYYHRWEMITPHTMRRFFATYMVVELGRYTPEEIMPITGHKSRGSFLKYIRVDNEATLKKISMDPAFIGPVGSSSDLSVVA